MTKTDKPTTRETMTSFRGRSLVVRLLSHTMQLRLKGTRTWFEVSYSQCFNRACLNAAAEARANKALKWKKGRK